MSSGLSPERARALFQRALDDELSVDEREALEAALAEDPALDAELSALRRVVQVASELGPPPSVDLLAQVQGKLRARSGGRFYRDRFSEKRGRGALLRWAIAGSILVVLVTVLWLSFEAGLLAR